GAGALVPVAVFVLLRFPPTSAAVLARAHAIIADTRIPNHAHPRWHVSFWIQGPLLVGALLVERRRPLCMVLLMLSGIALALTVLTKPTGNATLALLFPWRISVLVFPIATTILIARAVAAVRGGVALPVVLVSLCAAAAVSGLRHTLTEIRAYNEEPEVA